MKSETIEIMEKSNETRWGRIFSLSRPDYVHLRVFAWAEAMERSGDSLVSGRNPEEKLSIVSDRLGSYYGEIAGARILSGFRQAAEAALDGDASPVMAIADLAGRHVRNLGYSHPMIARTDGKAGLDERLDLELAILSWATAAAGGTVSMESGSVLVDDWLAPDILAGRLSMDMKAVFRSELEKMRRAIPVPDPAADPESFDMGDLFELQSAIARTVLYMAVSDDEKLIREAEAESLGCLSSLRSAAAQEIILKSIARMRDAAPVPLLRPADAFPGKDWGWSFSRDANMRYMAAADILLYGKNGSRIQLPEKEADTLFRRFAIIDSIYKGNERSGSCQLAKLYAAIETVSVCGIRRSISRSSGAAMKALQDDGYLDDKDRSRLEGIGKAAADRVDAVSRPSEAECRLRLARAGGMDNLQAGLALQLSEALMQGDGDGMGRVCAAVMDGARAAAGRSVGNRKMEHVKDGSVERN